MSRVAVPWPVRVVPPDGADDQWPEAVVMVSLDEERKKGSPIIVRPSRAFLRTGKRLLWLINAAPDDQVQIVFKRDDEVVRPRTGETHWRALLPGGPRLGPFRSGENEKDGEYSIKGAGEIDSGPAVRQGWFSYNIIWRRKGKEYKLDPAISIFDRAFAQQQLV